MEGLPLGGMSVKGMSVGAWNQQVVRGMRVRGIKTKRSFPQIKTLPPFQVPCSRGLETGDGEPNNGAGLGCETHTGGRPAAAKPAREAGKLSVS